MPQMGESIFEGTITKWLKKPGDTVQQDEPLFEISTDKVDAEIPSPAAGVLSEIKVQAGTTVQINTVVATIGVGRSPLPRLPSPPHPPRSPQPQHRPPKWRPKATRQTQKRENASVPRLWCAASPRKTIWICARFRVPDRRAGSPRKIFSAIWPRATRTRGPSRARRTQTSRTRARACRGQTARARRAAGRHAWG